MSDGQEDVSSQPLVIVRRRRQTEEAHHGGVWKIAYADFMTAMMAFFLVMWLVNAADKKTIVQVAAYFNPMRLTDRTIAPKGLEDISDLETRQAQDKGDKASPPHPATEEPDTKAGNPAEPGSGASKSDAAKKSSGSAAGSRRAEARKEDALFDDPDALLDQLAGEAKAQQAQIAASAVDTHVRDPFDRTVRATSPAPVENFSQQQRSANATPPPPVVADASKRDAQAAKDNLRAAAPPPVPAKPEKQATPAAKPSDPAKDQVTPVQGPKTGLVDKDSEAKKVASDISSAISKISRMLPEVEVKATPEGLLISLLDDAKFGMFEVGSAKPRPELVLVMDKIGGVLKDKPSNIVVRGHTDDRAYRSGNYDNWRLSASRAQMAHHMLVRGGVPEARFVAIEGRADRDPKIPSDTSAAQNRRIEILIREAPR